MSENANLDGLGTALDACIYHIGQAITAIESSRRDAEIAAIKLAHTSEGSSDDRLAMAISICASADATMETLVRKYVASVEELREYKREKGIA